MPRRPSRFSKGWKKYSSQRSSARKIQQAWRKRARPSATKRMILSNRKKIFKNQKNVEIKYLQTNLAISPTYVGQYTNSNTVDSAGLDQNLAIVGLRPFDGITQGVADGQRIGNTISLKRLTVRYIIKAGYLNPPPLVILPSEVKQFVTIVVIKDNDPTNNLTGAANPLPRWEEIFYSQLPAVFNPHTTFKDLIGVQDRFKVLKKITRVVKVNQPTYIGGGTPTDPHGANGTLANGTNEVRGSIHLESPYKFNYTDTGAFSHATNQGIYLIACSNVRPLLNQNNSNLPSIQFSTRVAYRDG